MQLINLSKLTRVTAVETLTEDGRTWTKEEIRNKIETDDRWLIRGLLAIYNLQTADEQNSEVTAHLNGVGFNGMDARFASNIATWYNDKGFLTPKQIKGVRRVMLKYAGQLTKIANGKIQPGHHDEVSEGYSPQTLNRIKQYVFKNIKRSHDGSSVTVEYDNIKFSGRTREDLIGKIADYLEAIDQDPDKNEWGEDIRHY